MRLAARTRQRHREEGAAAVEFALVVPILLLLVFGIIDYGLYFSDALAVRSGVREGARQGVVRTCTTMNCLADLVKQRIQPTAAGAKYVQIRVVDPVTRLPAAWKRGNDLLVCAVVKVDGVTGYVPLPDGDTTRASISMRIEQEPDTTAENSWDNDPLPPGGWGFCT